MSNKEFYDLMKRTFESCEKIAKAKGEDYTKGSQDALANFKEGGEDIDLDPLKVCWVFMNKHYQAITNYVKTGGQSESEPIAERLKDLINYAVLMQGLIIEKGLQYAEDYKSTFSDRSRVHNNDIINEDTLDMSKAHPPQ